ncbi:hypothetical protein CUMW_278920 [Citrus unshiu]|uniref:Uncharacterized protein n=1 Tax=Citrus unshiu TaxID=55188 RepID=A0A2H5N6P5_CITUN|nr:hypothetical protein CUMW_278920 [Citrus unshiu]
MQYTNNMSKATSMSKRCATSALVEVVGCCPHKRVRAAVQAPTKALWGLNVLNIYKSFSLAKCE